MGGGGSGSTIGAAPSRGASSSPAKRIFSSRFLRSSSVSSRTGSGFRTGSGSGLANVPGIIYRSPSHSFTDFQSLPGGAPNGACDPFMAPGAMDATVVCPIRTYSAGGPGFIYERTLDLCDALRVAG